MRTSELRNYRVWTEAIKTVREDLVELADGLRLDEKERVFARAALNACDRHAYPDDVVCWQANNQLAEKYACSARTITNWRNAGAPLDRGQWRMLDWLATRRSLPRSTETKFAKQLAIRRGEGPETLQTLLRDARDNAKLLQLAQSLVEPELHHASGVH